MVRDLRRREDIGVERHFVHSTGEGQKTRVVSRSNLAVESVVSKVACPAARSDRGGAVDIEDESGSVESHRQVVPGQGLDRNARGLGKRSILDVQNPETRGPW